jgi:putative ABC transport system permease protein
VLIPLPIATQLAGAAGKVNTISVAVASAADVGAVAKRIRALLPWAVVTTSSSLAGDLTGSLDDASRLANSLGRWVSVAALLAAVALAALLTLAAVSRRVREFGTLKALGWRSRRVVGQVVGESAVVGLCGAALGVALGFGGAALVSALAPSLTARVAYAPGQHEQQAMLTTASNGVAHSRTFDAPGTYHTVPVHFSAPVPAAVLLLAVVLGVLGALLAGAAGGWRAARLRPAAALTAVG